MASNAEEAINIIDSSAVIFDIIFVDQELSYLEGLLKGSDVVTKIHSLPVFESSLIIGCTGKFYASGGLYASRGLRSRKN